jgi:hypothetical protein
MRPPDAALQLAAQGTPCFPCADSKRPTCPNGFKAATAEPDKLRTLWTAYPGPLIGVRTGETSGLFVLDIDAKHPEALKWWSANEDRLPRTRLHSTRSGGLHCLFRHQVGMRCTASKLAVGVDTRGEGGYIIFWPAHGCRVLCDAPIANAPAWVIEALRPPSPALRSKVGPISIRGDKRALRGLIRVVATANEGERNRLLFWAGCRAAELIADGNLSEGETIAELAAAAAHAGLPEREAIRTIRNGLGAGKR